MNLHIEVTRSDIYNGIPGEGSNCPIALALSRELDALNFHYRMLDVGSREIRVYRYQGSGEEDLTALIPKVAERFIEEFDELDNVPSGSPRWDQVPEIEFDLELRAIR